MTVKKTSPLPIRSLFWSLVERAGALGIQVLISIVLARILSPKEFGLLAMVSVFIAVGSLLTDSGFGTALLRLPAPTASQCASVFYFNMTVSVLCAAMLCAMSGTIAAFFRTPELRLVVCAMSLALVFNSLSLVQTVMLTRLLNFRDQARATLPAAAISGVVAVFFAWCGWGVWALVVQSLLSSLLRSILLWRFNSWRPQTGFSLSGMQGLFGFSCRLLASSGLDMAFNQAYPLIIGRLYEARQLGLYNLAQQFQQLPVGIVTSVYSRVNFPMMSEAQETTSRLLQVFRQALQFLSAAIVLIMICLFVSADDVVVLSVGPQWRDCVPYLRIMCILGLLLPLHMLNLDLLRVRGRSDLFLRLEVIKKALGLLALLVTWHFGVRALLWGQVAVSVVALVVNAYYTGHLVDYGFVQQVRELGGTFGAGALAAAAGWSIRSFLVGPPLALLGVACAVTGSFFVLLLAVLNGVGFSICRDSLYVSELFMRFRRKSNLSI
jgi:teichuronic acid exporter